MPFEPVTVAAVQAAPIFLDRERTIEKACRLAAEAAAHGAQLVVFPEVFVAGYPYWNWYLSPLKASSWFPRLRESAVDLEGTDLDPVVDVATQHGIHIVLGVNERVRYSLGTVFNTNVLIGPDGVRARHRKLVPTFAEKLTWAQGDGSSLRVHETPFGPLGMLACGENTNLLARYALLAQGELIHVANYIAFPFTQNYDMPQAIQIRAGAHSFEGKVFTVVSCSAMTTELIDVLQPTEKQAEMLTGTPNAFSGVFGPDGRLVGDELIDVEGILYTDIDLNRCIEPKQYHDIQGHYNRFDIFNLSVNRHAQAPLRCYDDPVEHHAERTHSEDPNSSDTSAPSQQYRSLLKAEEL